MSRLTTWIKRSISTVTTPTSPSAPKSPSTSPFYKCEPARPSTPGSHTACHTRQDSHDTTTTATVTLYASSRAESPVSSLASSPPRKPKRVPAPLNLAQEKEMGFAIEKALDSARSLRLTPNYNLLKGMEITAKDVGAGLNGERRSFLPSPGAVGVAF